MIVCTAFTAQSLNQSYIRLTAGRLSRRLVTFTDAVLQPQALRDIYTSVDYDVREINAEKVVNNLSSALGKLTADADIITAIFIAIRYPIGSPIIVPIWNVVFA